MGESIGDRLKKLRRRQNLTQREIAQQLGITQSAYAHYEADRHQPDFMALAKLSEILGAPLDYLLTGQPQGETRPPDYPYTAPAPPGPAPPDWAALAYQLAEAMRMQAENERLRAENERLRIERVEAVAQENLRRILDRLEALEAPHATGREGAGTARADQARAEAE